ncbi:MAG TPA: hypothetical protein VLE53_18065 [Gemmatimonadaceae bacterium]|nr:hypothetical protein [Gemmatimonadaceae bacterium]
MLSSICRLSPRTGAVRLVSLAAVVGLAATAACDDPFQPRATTAVRTDSFLVWALSGTPVNVPTAFNVVFFTPVRVEPTYGFHLAFDIDAQGRVELIPVTKVGGIVTAGRRVGIQKATVPFEQLARAPAVGYHYDSVFVLTPGETAVVELGAEQCPLGVSQIVYAKLAINAVDQVNRQLSFRVTYDPNCGFRSFLPGIPTN